MDIAPYLKKPRIVFAAIFVLVLVLYGKSISFERVLDDDIVLDNQYVLEGLSATGKIFSNGFLKAFNGVSVSYRPLPTFTFAFEQSVFGGNPALRRLFNLLLYAGCGFLIWLLSKSWFPKQKDWFHALLAVLFIAHPIHTEVVSNLKSRDEILTLFFLLGSLVYLDRYLTKKQSATLIASAACFFLALLSKENAVSFIIIIPLVLYVFYKQSLSQIVKTVAPFAAPLVVYFLIRLVVLDDGVSATGLTHVINNAFVVSTGMVDRLASSSYLLLLYFQKLVLPINLSWDYSYPVIQYVPLSSTLGVASLTGAVLLSGAGLYLLYKKNVFGWAITCIIISLGLVLNFVVLIGANFAERFLFTPSLFFVIALGLVFAYGLSQPKYQKASKALLAVVLLFYSYQTFTRNLDWQSSETLFMASLETYPESSRVQTAMGTIYRVKAEKMAPSPQQENMYKKAIRHYDLAIKSLPENFDAWFNKGVIYQSTGGKKLAKECFEKVIEVNPNFTGAWNNMGFLSFNEKDYPKALEYFLKADSISPDNAQVLGNIASSYHNMRQYEQARPYYERSLAINPNQADVRANYGKLPK